MRARAVSVAAHGVIHDLDEVPVVPGEHRVLERELRPVRVLHRTDAPPVIGLERDMLSTVGSIGARRDQHLLDRVGTVIRLAQDPRAKLQYFQTMFDFR